MGFGEAEGLADGEVEGVVLLLLLLLLQAASASVVAANAATTALRRRHRVAGIYDTAKLLLCSLTGRWVSG